MKYRTIVADPPWRYDTTAPLASGGNAGAEAQYSTMALDEICALPVGESADKDCHLYLWITNPLLFEGKRVCDSWGFRYITLLTWHKLGKLGLGYYFRGDTEHVIFGIRGKAPIEPALRVSNHFAASRTVHSAKPDRFYEIVERVSPGPYLELFARRRRYGWDVWGDEAPTEQASQAEMGLDAA